MKLNIQEQFLLLTKHPTKGKFIIADSHIKFGIIGALLLKISFDDNIILEKDKLILNDNINNDNAMISEISIIIKDAKKNKKLSYWITKLSKYAEKYKQNILSNFGKNGMLRIEEKKFIGIFPYTKYFLIENSIRENIIQQVKNNILNKKSLSNEELTLLVLIQACNMFKIISSDRVEIKLLKMKLKDIIKENNTKPEIVNAIIKSIKEAIMNEIVSTVITSGA